jgi:hypothetical protein
MRPAVKALRANIEVEQLRAFKLAFEFTIREPQQDATPLFRRYFLSDAILRRRSE